MIRIFISQCGEKLQFQITETGELKMSPQDASHKSRRCEHCREKTKFVKKLIKAGK